MEREGTSGGEARSDDGPPPTEGREAVTPSAPVAAAPTGAAASPAATPDDYADESRWRLLSHAIRGTGGDPTQGPVRRAIVLLAVPMVLEMAMESIFAVVDIFFVSRLGDEAMAGVALTESIMTLIYTVAMGLSIGVTAVVARRIGEGDPDGAGRATVQAVLIGIAFALAFAAVGLLFDEELLRLMGADAATVEVAAPYTRILIGFNVVIVLLFLQNAAFRGAGDAAIAMRVLWLANGLNIILDPCLIFGLGPFPEMGVQGAAVATTIGRGTAVVVQLYTLLRLGGHLRVAAEHLRVELSVMWRIVRLSATGTFQIFIGMASWIGLVRITAEFGAEALAGYAIAVRIILFALLPAWGLSNAASTMVGQGLGAGDPERAEESVWIACRMNLAFLGAVGLLFILFAPGIVGLFGGTGLTSEYAVDCLRIVAAGFLFYAYGMVLTAAFNGAGAVWTPTIINLFCFWLWEIPLAWALAYPVGMGPNGVFTAIAVAYATLAVVSWVLFKRGRWKEATV
ncbi:MAG: MATE family efflux transporter [Longimicrobiales bacterium]|nr:MATE family efflux transporter [Longimicrobiales bacterium]